ncbi:MAG: flagellar capping protein, partial [Lachnospiraceae bacterium]|nr:flagellar capping protein [Lachnospiraceae bacterium]
HYQEDIDQIGFYFDKSGQLEIDDDAFKSSILSDENRTRFTTIRDFTNTVLRKTNQVSLNPMEYVDKRLVAYKNPGHNFATPYMTSNYSGMLFNGYC